MSQMQNQKEKTNVNTPIGPVSFEIKKTTFICKIH